MGVRGSATAVYQVEPESALAREDEVPHGYKRTEVGVIPEDWSLTALGTLLSFKNGLNKGKEYFGRGSPIVNYMDVYAFPKIYASRLQGRVEVTKQEIDSYSVRRGDVFFTRTSETVDEVGVASVLVDDSPNTVFSGFVLRARSKNDALAIGFKSYCFSTQVIREQITSKSTYTTRALTNGRALSDVLLPLPPTKLQQEAIAEALADADALIESLQQLIAKKRAIKQGAMQALLTGRQRLPGFWEGWQRKKIDDVFQMRIAGSKAQFINNGGAYYIVDMGSVSRDGHLIVSKVTDHDRDRLMEGELVMPKDDIGGGNIIGKVAYIDASNRYVLGDHVYALRAMSGDPRFFAYLINGYETNHALRSKVGGSAQLGLSQQAVREQEIYFPPLAEQTAIATVLSDIDAEIEALEARLAKTRALKAGMMQALLTGRIRLPLDRAA